MKYKRYISYILAITMLISSINIGFALDEKVSETINVSEEDGIALKEENISENKESAINILENIEPEPNETDNWELGLVFYDSTVNNGTTPLTEINWNASNGAYETGKSRVITVQINYRNTNCVKTYQPRELEISIPNLIYNTGENKDGSPYWQTSVIVGANDSTHTGYDWNFVTGNKPTNAQERYQFQNTNTIEAKSNFEGSIQIVYTITPSYENPEQYDDYCEHLYTKNLIASLENIISSNEVNFIYFRKYIHPWQRKEYKATKTASKITSYDGLGTNASDYIWVKYGLKHTNNFGSAYYPYPYIDAKNGFYKDNIPKECIVYDENMNLLTPDENWNYSIQANSNQNIYSYIYVGYPKSIYNEENGNLNITNEVELWGTYNNRTEPELLSTSSVNLNLVDYEFVYSGNLYGINKSSQNVGLGLYQQDIQRNLENNKSYWYLYPTAIYTGNPMTVKIGDDLLMATSNNGNYVKLKDDEYHFYQIKFYSKYFKNGNNQMIQANKYDCELWVRYKNTDKYILYESFKNPSDTKTWTFTKENGVVGFYFMIYDMNESILHSILDSELINVYTKFHKQNIPESGYLYNFCYLQVYFKDENENLILQNEPDLSSYNNFITKNDIATFDLSTYGTYMQRSYNYHSWKYFDVNTFKVKFQAQKSSSSVIQDIINEKFTGTYTVSNKINGANINLNYKDDIDSGRAVKGFRIFDLLPKGMELTSTKEEIKNSLNIEKGNSLRFYDLNFKELSLDEVKEITNTNVIIIENWNNTGRTKIEIQTIFSHPVYLHNINSSILFKYSYNYSISYDSVLEYGKIWTNYCYVDKLDTQKKGIELLAGYTVFDNGSYDSEAVDIDEDGDITDKLSYARVQITITSVISTHQDVQKSVKTDKSNYSTGTVESSLNSEYEYKLRARTGQNDVTNLIIYDSLEEYAQNPEGEFVPAYGDKEHWNGEFLGIDTSYAESKGYTVKTYYSENIQAGNLYDEAHNLNSDWKEYVNPIEPVYSNGLKIKFNENCKTYDSYDYVYLYYYSYGRYCRSQQLYGTNIAGKEIEIPSTEFYLYWHTSSTTRNYYGFSIDSIEPILTDNIFISTIFSLPNYNIIELNGNNYPESLHNPYNSGATNTLWYYSEEKQILEEGYDVVNMSKVKSLAFEYLDENGNPAIIPANSLTYVLIKMKSPNNENITSLAYNGCRTQWQGLDEFKQPVDFITGINSNIVKVSLPNTKRGSYLVKHEYYVRDFEGNLTLENTVSEETISNIPVDTVIKAKEQNHIEQNNGKTYAFIENNGDIIIREDETQEIILKYVRNKEYGSYQVKHEYYVKEKAETNALAVTFNSKCSGESANYDYLELYYQKDGKTYKLGKYRANDLAGKTVNIPSSDFYLYWKTDSSQNNYYGFSIDKIEPVYLEESVSGTTVTLPNYTVIELTGNNYPETEHNPYKNNSNLLWHYVGIPQKTEETKYTLENTYSEELVPNIQIGTLIKAEEQNHIEMNNNKQYTFSEDTGDIAIEKNVTKEIVLKYIREQEYGSYVVKHEYYVKDFNNNLTLENTVSEEPVSNIPVDTVIKAEEQNHIETNNDKQYTYTEDTGDITIQKDVTKEIIIKYVRDEEYTTEMPETGSTDNIKNLISIIFFLLLGVTSFFIADKKKQY